MTPAASTTSSFFKECVIIHLFSFFLLFQAQAQTKGVWGNTSNVKYQKAGESYVGAKIGFGDAPTGLSFFTHLSKNQGLEIYLGYKNAHKNNLRDFEKGGNTLLGVSFQPKLNFRTDNLTGSYYLNVGGRMRVHHNRLENKSARAISSQEGSSSAITPDFVFGLGASLELYKKFQLFAEMNQAYYAETSSKGKNTYSFGDMETSIGIRRFIF